MNPAGYLDSETLQTTKHIAKEGAAFFYGLGSGVVQGLGTKYLARKWNCQDEAHQKYHEKQIFDLKKNLFLMNNYLNLAWQTGNFITHTILGKDVPLYEYLKNFALYDVGVALGLAIVPIRPRRPRSSKENKISKFMQKIAEPIKLPTPVQMYEEIT